MTFARPLAAAALTLLVSFHPVHSEAVAEDVASGADDEACDMQQTLLQTQFRLGRGNSAAAVGPEEARTPPEERAILKSANPAEGFANSVEASPSADILKLRFGGGVSGGVPRRMPVDSVKRVNLAQVMSYPQAVETVVESEEQPAEVQLATLSDAAVMEADFAQELSNPKVVSAVDSDGELAEVQPATSTDDAFMEEVAAEAPGLAEHPTLAQAAEQLAEATASVEAAAFAEQPALTQVAEQLSEAGRLLARASSVLRKEEEACGLADASDENAQMAHLVPSNGLICYQGSKQEMDRVFCLLRTAPTRALYPGSSVELGACASSGFDHLEHNPDDCWVNSQKWLRSNTDDLDQWKDAQEAIWHEYNDAEGIEDFMDIRGGMTLSGCICLPGSDVMNAMGDMCAEVQDLGLLPLAPLP